MISTTVHFLMLYTLLAKKKQNKKQTKKNNKKRKIIIQNRFFPFPKRLSRYSPLPSVLK